MRKNISFTVAVILSGVLIALFLFLHTEIWRREPLSSHKVYFADHISPAHQLIIDRFNALHKGSIEVVPINLPFDKFTTNERKELLARSLRNRSDQIDVFAVDLIWIPRFSKWCEPLGNSFGTTVVGEIIENALEPCYVESSLVALPLYLDIGMLYYRRDLLQRHSHARDIEERLKNSMTWDEFLGLRSVLAPDGRPFYIFSGKDYEGLVCSYLELLVGQLPSYSSATEIDLGTIEARKALQMMVDFVRTTGVSPPQVTDFDENRSYDFMLATDGIFCRGWPNFLENYMTFYPDTVKLQKIGRGAMPHFRGMKPRSVFGGWNLMLSKYSKHKPQAVEFIRFLQSEETQKTMFEIGGYLPTNRRVYEDTAFIARHPNLAYYKSLLAHGFHRPALTDYTRMSDIISRYIHKALRGEMTVDEALAVARKEMASPFLPEK